MQTRCGPDVSPLPAANTVLMLNIAMGGGWVGGQEDSCDIRAEGCRAWVIPQAAAPSGRVECVWDGWMCSSMQLACVWRVGGSGKQSQACHQGFRFKTLTPGPPTRLTEVK